VVSLDGSTELRDDPREFIVEQAETHKVDCIVLGARGMSPIAGYARTTAVAVGERNCPLTNSDLKCADWFSARCPTMWSITRRAAFSLQSDLDCGKEEESINTMAAIIPPALLAVVLDTTGLLFGMSNDDDGAGRVAHDVVADRAQHHAFDRRESSRSQNDVVDVCNTH
jgi:hypothetical protein